MMIQMKQYIQLMKNLLIQNLFNIIVEFHYKNIWKREIKTMKTKVDIISGIYVVWSTEI